jgi:hypothetical protein
MNDTKQYVDLGKVLKSYRKLAATFALRSQPSIVRPIAMPIKNYGVRVSVEEEIEEDTKCRTYNRAYEQLVQEFWWLEELENSDD